MNNLTASIELFNRRLSEIHEGESKEDRLLYAIFGDGIDRKKSDNRLICACVEMIGAYLDSDPADVKGCDLHFTYNEMGEMLHDLLNNDARDRLGIRENGSEADAAETAAHWAHRLLLYEIIMEIVRASMEATDAKPDETFCIPAMLSIPLCDHCEEDEKP